MMRLVKQEDIAKMLNISRTTVARALNGNKNIKPETKEKILNLAEELGYKKNPISSSLARKKNKNIYAFIIESRNKYYTEKIKAGLKEAETEFSFYGYSINIIQTDIETPEKQLIELKKIIKEKDVEGIIITPLLKKEIKEIKMQNPQIHFITLDIPLDNSIFYVGPNYFKSGRIAAEILISTLQQDEKILVLDTVDDRISSKLYMDGFLSRVKEENTNFIVGPIYSENLMKDIKSILEEYMTTNVKAIYATRFLTDIVKYIDNKYNKKMNIIGNGMSEDMKKLIMNKKIIATVIEKCYEEGYFAGKFMFEKLYKDMENVNNKYIMDSRIVVRETML
ncbi:LacI family DNA-binding transcriptional regulator [Clostridium niameyense]|uniref:LacI family DNA-binding transcriptional regulator n=1 Tax=Clostridium niameyense TaxID=1622073 RepID=UPI000B06FED3|nr:LacI family DNA-binding transcriptional regulator [Clostridium niameyense]